MVIQVLLVVAVTKSTFASRYLLLHLYIYLVLAVQCILGHHKDKDVTICCRTGHWKFKTKSKGQYLAADVGMSLLY